MLVKPKHNNSPLSSPKRVVLLLFAALFFSVSPVIAQIILPWIQREDIRHLFPEDVRVWEVFSPLPSGRPLHAHYAEIPRFYSLKAGIAEGLHATGWFAARHGSLLTINAGFFAAPTPKNPSGSVGLIIQGAKTVTPNIQTMTKNSEGKNVSLYPTRAAFGRTNLTGVSEVYWVYSVERNDTLQTFAYTSPSLNKKGEKPLPIPDEHFPFTAKHWKPDMAVGGMPVLLYQGKIVLHTSIAAELTPPDLLLAHPRTCIGYRLDGTVILLVIDGRQELSKGADLYETAGIMAGLGCYSAINLDGGGSSTMVYRSETQDSALYLPVNIPIDKTTPGVQRKVATTVEVSPPRGYEVPRSILITPHHNNGYHEVGGWNNKAQPLEFPGSISRVTENTDGDSRAMFNLDGVPRGWYQVRLWWAYDKNNAEKVKVNIVPRGSTNNTVCFINQSDKSTAYKWNVLGEFFVGKGDSVIISAENKDFQPEKNGGLIQVNALQLLPSYPARESKNIPTEVLYPITKYKKPLFINTVQIIQSGWYSISGYSQTGLQLQNFPRIFLHEGNYPLQHLFPGGKPDWYEIIGEKTSQRRYCRTDKELHLFFP